MVLARNHITRVPPFGEVDIVAEIKHKKKRMNEDVMNQCRLNKTCHIPRQEKPSRCCVMKTKTIQMLTAKIVIDPTGSDQTI